MNIVCIENSTLFCLDTILLIHNVVVHIRHGIGFPHFSIHCSFDHYLRYKTKHGN